MAHDSTTEGLEEIPQRPGRWVHRIGMALLVLLIAAALVGLLDPRTGTVADSGGGYELTVAYPAVDKAGLSAPLHISVHRPGGFDGSTVQLALCDDLVDTLDFHSWYPTPSAETGAPSALVYEFDVPPGETLEVSLDARHTPEQLTEYVECEISVLEQDEPVASVSFTSWRLP